MPWYAYVMIGVYVLNVVMSIAMIGQPRSKPHYDVQGALWALGISTLMIWGIVSLAGAV